VQRFDDIADARHTAAKLGFERTEVKQ
jgi:hypothetical protein